ncbi:MAG: dTDP-4-dehydrorhamnose reductase [Nanopusillaceae archaeon]
MKILIVGASGLLGNYLVKLGKEKNYEIYGTYNQHEIKETNFLKLDVRDRKKAIEIITKIKPDVVIDTHSITNVDYCELHPEECWEVNVNGTKNVVEACKILGCKLVFISTDYVFDGKKTIYTEKDKPHPINFYGRTKYICEKIIEAFDIENLIIRTSVLYGVGGSGKEPFPIWVIRNLKENNKIEVVVDQFNNPTYCGDLAKIIFTLIEKRKRGLFHVVGKDNVSRYEFAIKIAEIFGMNKKLILPITSSQLLQHAPRPKKLNLSIHKLKRVLNVETMGIEEGLKELKKELLK